MTIKTILALNLLAASALFSCAPSRVTPINDIEPKLVENFRREHEKFSVQGVPDGLGKTVMVKSLSKSQTLLICGELKLQLDLGSRFKVGTTSAYRTESRYRLIDTKGKTLASAESTLATDDSGNESSAEISILADDESKVFFIAEEQSWATRRGIVILPAHTSEESGNDAPKKWEARYVSLPFRTNAGLLHVDPNLLGIKNGCLYFSMDDRYYAMPFGNLPVEDKLEFTIG